jgi:hypothetical protein
MVWKVWGLDIQLHALWISAPVAGKVQLLYSCWKNTRRLVGPQSQSSEFGDFRRPYRESNTSSVAQSTAIAVVRFITWRYQYLGLISAAARPTAWVCGRTLLEFRVRVLPGAWISVSCECCVSSDRCLCVRLVTRTQESYRVWCVWVWSWSLVHEEALLH